MNSMKKIFKLSVAFVTLLVTLMVPSQVNADSNPVAKLNIDVKSRSEIIATVSVPANYDSLGYSVDLEYDAETVQLVKSAFIKDIKAFDPDGEEVQVIVINNTKNLGKASVKVATTYPIEHKESYTLMTLTFSLLDGQQLSDDSIKLAKWDISSDDGTHAISSNKTDKEEVELKCTHAETVTNVVKEATCSQKGQEDVVCMLCGHTVSSKELPTLPHTFGQWTTVKEATCEEKGTQERKCSVCGETETKEIAALGHDYGEAVVTKEPTCIEKGIKTRTCKHCGKEITEEIPTVDHKFGLWTTVKEATCEEKGTQERKCSVCGKTETKEIAALGHDYGEAVVTKEPTCVEKGIKTKTCKHCGKEITEEIPMVDHTYGQWTVTKEATETEEGSKERVCSVCGEKEVVAIAKKETTQPTKPSTDDKINQTTNKDNTTAKKDDKVKTGDDSNSSMYGLLVVDSIVLAAIVYCVSKRREILNK